MTNSHPELAMDANAQSEPCKYFRVAFGNVANRAELDSMLSDINASEAGAEYTESLTKTAVVNAVMLEALKHNARRSGRLMTSAQGTRTALKCGSCIMDQSCPMESLLERMIFRDDLVVASAVEDFEMFSSGPEWLAFARLHNLGMTVDDLDRVTRDDDSLAEFIYNKLLYRETRATPS